MSNKSKALKNYCLFDCLFSAYEQKFSLYAFLTGGRFDALSFQVSLKSYPLTLSVCNA